MIDEDLKSLCKSEISGSETLLWAEEINLRPFIIRRWLWRIIRLAGYNLLVWALYLSGIGGFSPKTIFVLFGALNGGILAVSLVQIYEDYFIFHSRGGHVLTDKRIMTLNWSKKGSVKKQTYIPMNVLDAYTLSRGPALTKVDFLNADLEKVFAIHTARPASEFKTIISPFLRKIFK